MRVVGSDCDLKSGRQRWLLLWTDRMIKDLLPLQLHGMLLLVPIGNVLVLLLIVVSRIISGGGCPIKAINLPVWIIRYCFCL